MFCLASFCLVFALPCFCLALFVLPCLVFALPCLFSSFSLLFPCYLNSTPHNSVRNRALDMKERSVSIFGSAKKVLYSVLSCLALSRDALVVFLWLSPLVLPWLVLSCLFCHVMSFVVMSCLLLSCLVLSCLFLVLSRRIFSSLVVL